MISSTRSPLPVDRVPGPLRGSRRSRQARRCQRRREARRHRPPARGDDHVLRRRPRSRIRTVVRAMRPPLSRLRRARMRRRRRVQRPDRRGPTPPTKRTRTGTTGTQWRWGGTRTTDVSCRRGVSRRVPERRGHADLYTAREHPVRTANRWRTGPSSAGCGRASVPTGRARTCGGAGTRGDRAAIPPSTRVPGGVTTGRDHAAGSLRAMCGVRVRQTDGARVRAGSGSGGDRTIVAAAIVIGTTATAVTGTAMIATGRIAPGGNGTATAGGARSVPLIRPHAKGMRIVRREARAAGRRRSTSRPPWQVPSRVTWVRR